MNNVYVKLYGPHSIMMSFSNPGLIKWVDSTKIRFYYIQKKRWPPNPLKGEQERNKSQEARDKTNLNPSFDSCFLALHLPL